MSAATGTALYPGAATFPGAAVYPGQGTKPSPWVLLATNDASEPPEWTTVTSLTRSFTSSRGRSSELADMDAGTADGVFDNRTRTFDPTNDPNISPLNRLWIREQFAGETQDIFLGYVESYDQQWVKGSLDAVAVVGAADEFKVLALDNLPVPSPPRDSYAEVVTYDGPAAYWQMNDPKGGSIAGTVGPELFAVGTVDVNESSSAIVGDRGGEIVLAAGSELTARVSDGFDDVGATWTVSEPALDGAGLTSYAIEFWLRFETWSDPGVSPDRLVSLPDTILYSSTIDGQADVVVNTGGTISLRVVKTAVNGHATVTSPTALLTTDPTRWYHIVGSNDGANLRLYIDGSLVATTAYATALGDVGPDGFFRVGDAAGASSISVDEVAFYRTELTADRVAAHYQAGAQRGFPAQLPGQRIDAVLDSVSNHAPRRLDAGTRTILATSMRGQDPLGEVREAVRGEAADGTVFISKSGEVVELDSSHRTRSPYSTVQATFSDTPSVSGLPYADIDVDFSDAFLTNEWNLTSAGGPLHTFRDETSIARYGKRSQSLTDLPLFYDADVDAIGSDLLDRYADPVYRVLSLDLDLLASADLCQQAFRLDLGDRIRVYRTLPSGGVIDRHFFIQKIEVSASASTWTMRLGLETGASVPFLELIDGGGITTFGTLASTYSTFDGMVS